MALVTHYRLRVLVEKRGKCSVALRDRAVGVHQRHRIEHGVEGGLPAGVGYLQRPLGRTAFCRA
ncbi:MAG: hypothetical protein NT169_08800 [Chloroflexi bacterium]|nr:hypothetical protein [Chloroflexota bacterium]